MEWKDEVKDLLNRNELRKALALIQLNIPGENQPSASIINAITQELNVYYEEIGLAETRKIGIVYGIKNLIKTVEEEVIRSKYATVLFLTSTPLGMSSIKVGNEHLKISTKLKNSDVRVSSQPNISANAISGEILEVKPSFIHFSGHGVKEMPGFNDRGIVLRRSNGDSHVYENSIIVNLIRVSTLTKNTRQNLRCVFFNTCYSDELAQELSKLGVYTIGMSDEISDNSAIAFSIGFYEKIAYNKNDILNAFNSGIVMIEVDGKKSEATIPCLFLDGVKINNTKTASK